MQYGRSIVPILSFGEQDLFDVKRRFSTIEDWLKTHIDNKITLPWFSGKYGLPIPYDIPITCVIGKPITVNKIKNPSDKDIDKYHKKFYNRIKKLFYKYKDHTDVSVKYDDIVFVNE